MTDKIKEMRFNCGLHSTPGPCIDYLMDLSDEALRDLLPDNYELQNGHDKRPLEEDKVPAWELRTTDWQEQQFRKSAKAVRAVVTALREFYPNGGITVTVPGDYWKATIPPFDVRLSYTSKVDKKKKYALEEDMDPMKKTE
jgi:hypothetical protein